MRLSRGLGALSCSPLVEDCVGGNSPAFGERGSISFEAE
jgi:hypothetical protein